MTTQSFGEAVDLFEKYRAEYLSAARSFMMKYGADGRIVTVNDLIEHGPPLPEGIDPRVRGAVFTSKEIWERVGYTSSDRKVSHGRPVQRFRLVGS